MRRKNDVLDKISDLDGHPNKQGHERIAEFLYDRLG